MDLVADVLRDVKWSTMVILAGVLDMALLAFVGVLVLIFLVFKVSEALAWLS